MALIHPRSLEELPEDCLLAVFSLCEPVTRFVLSHVCRYFHALVPSHEHDCSAREFVSSAIRFNSSLLIEWGRAFPRPVTLPTAQPDPLSDAASLGHAKLVHLLVQLGCKPTANVTTVAVYNGRYELFKELVAKDFPWDGNTVVAMASMGRTDLLEWAVDNEVTIDYVLGGRLIAAAAMYGHIDVLRWLKHQHNVRPMDYGSQVLIAAAQSGSVELLEWLSANEHQMAPVLNTPNAFSFAVSLTPLAAAVQSGSFGAIHYLLQAGNTDWGSAAKEAAIYGHKDILEWIVTQGCPLKGDEMAAAALSGHDEVFKWLHSRSPQIPVTTAAIFAKRNSPDMVRFCVDAGVPLHADLCCMAAYGGNLTLLKLLRRWGCEWDHRTLSYSIESNHTEIFAWAFTNGCPYEPRPDLVRQSPLPSPGYPSLHNDETPIGVAIKKNRIKLVQWLHAKGCPKFASDFVQASALGRIEIMEWMLLQGWEMTVECPAAAALNGQIRAIRWLYEHRCPWDSSRIILPPVGSWGFSRQHKHLPEIDRFLGEVASARGSSPQRDRDRPFILL